MTLLEATATLIDAVKTWAPGEDRKLKAAVKRMEKRLRLLQLRARKAFRRRRWSAWYQACADYGEVWHPPGRPTRRLTDPICGQCFHMINYREFCHSAEFGGRGNLLVLCCPYCDFPMTGLEPVIDEDLEAQRFTDGDWLPGH